MKERGSNCPHIYLLGYVPAYEGLRHLVMSYESWTVRRAPKHQNHLHTPPWRIRLKARVDRADRTYADLRQKYVKIRQDGRAYYLKGIKLRCLIAKVV